jgi:5-methylcytosine-specific restriction endonuclease McrA
MPTRSDVNPWRDEAALRWAYLEKYDSLSAAGDVLGCSGNCLSKWLNRKNIEVNLHECPTCNEKFHTEQAVKTHHAKAHGQSIAGVTQTCTVCGEEFTLPPADAEGRKYCSEQCMATAFNEQETLNCDECGSDFSVRQSRVEDARFCSHECAIVSNSRDRRERVTVPCAGCGSEFETHPYRTEISDNLFCSQSCYSDWRDGRPMPENENSVETECDWCGEVFKKQRAKYERTERHFCDFNCFQSWHSENMVGEASPRWKGGPAPYGKGWTQQKREAVRERDSHECQDCGLTSEEHHEQYGEKLHVHHIRPAREFDDPEKRNAKENLITLCHGCHLGKWEPMTPLVPEHAAD